ncbi:hypothetical protein EIP86_004045 [Pleurotus ostreatoroseus]|nr:hypothetical protein EIP86_004045 [Pleurotus ostreatoroseus]
MGKRPKVPATLHSELSEYSSLLRALRTSDTLDLATQLTAPAPTLVSSHDADDEADDGASERFQTSSVAASIEGSQASSSKSQHRGKAKRDLWTRWPLLAGDVHVPEWTLEDEVKLLALHALQSHPPSIELSEQQDLQREEDSDDVHTPTGETSTDAPVSDSEVPGNIFDSPEDTIDLEQLLTPMFLSSLTSSTGVFLARMLALLAAYVPSGGTSMQNRVHPIGWRSVLDIAAVNGLVNASTVERVREQLTILYHPDPSPSHTFLDDDPLRQACAAYDGSYLRIDGYTPQRAQPKRE